MLLEKRSKLYPWEQAEPYSMFCQELIPSCPGYGNGLAFSFINEAKHNPTASPGPPTPAKLK